MSRTRTVRALALGLAALALLAACTGGSPAPAPTDEPAGDAPAITDDPAASDGPATTDDPAMSDAPAASDGPATGLLEDHPWATQTLTDVTTGESFRIADLAGRTVFVEAMAIWCSNCRAQQGRFTEAFGHLPAGTAEYVVLTVDPSETAQELARYKADRGFTGRYAVAGKRLSKALEAEFGANVLNPPSVPLITISPEGEVSFATGGESVNAIVERAGG